MQLETNRLILRNPKVQDAQAYTRIQNSEFVLRFNAMAPTTPERMKQKIEDLEYQDNTVFLEERETGTFIGAIFLDEDDLRYGVASKSVSYFIREDYSRKGFMKEAMDALIGHLFEKENLECISARAFAPNTASRALLKSLGFMENGVIPRCVKGFGDIVYDDVIHTLLREAFHKE